jgi:heme exporter protein D
VKGRMRGLCLAVACAFSSFAFFLAVRSLCFKFWLSVRLTYLELVHHVHQ